MQPAYPNQTQTTKHAPITTTTLNQEHQTKTTNYHQGLKPGAPNQDHQLPPRLNPVAPNQPKFTYASETSCSSMKKCQIVRCRLTVVFGNCADTIQNQNPDAGRTPIATQTPTPPAVHTNRGKPNQYQSKECSLSLSAPECFCFLMSTQTNTPYPSSPPIC